jgi:hypothetical protein
MQKWQYGMALYTSKANERTMLDFHNSELSMDDLDASKGISLTYFLKAAGERGWELMSVLYPWAPGHSFTEEREGASICDGKRPLRDSMAALQAPDTIEPAYSLSGKGLLKPQGCPRQILRGVDVALADVELLGYFLAGVDGLVRFVIFDRTGWLAPCPL